MPTMVIQRGHGMACPPYGIHGRTGHGGSAAPTEQRAERDAACVAASSSLLRRRRRSRPGSRRLPRASASRDLAPSSSAKRAVGALPMTTTAPASRGSQVSPPLPSGWWRARRARLGHARIIQQCRRSRFPAAAMRAMIAVTRHLAVGEDGCAGVQRGARRFRQRSADSAARRRYRSCRWHGSARSAMAVIGAGRLGEIRHRRGWSRRTGHRSRPGSRR